MATMYSFGPFRLDGESKILFRGTEPTPAGQRAVALLRVLVEQPGAPVSKDALIEALARACDRRQQFDGPDCRST
jgi:DNA-binding winged helix-turn-helix (wHTH) protein